MPILFDSTHSTTVLYNTTVFVLQNRDPTRNPRPKPRHIVRNRALAQAPCSFSVVGRVPHPPGAPGPKTETILEQEEHKTESIPTQDQNQDRTNTKA